MSNPTYILAVMQDLMFMVRIQEEAKRAGLKTIAVKSRVDAVRKAAEQPGLIFIDLNYQDGEPLELIKELKADPGTSNIHLVGFVSHVQADLRAAAVAEGCDTVLPRSAFVHKLPEIIDSHLPR